MLTDNYRNIRCRIVALVAAPGALASSLQSSIEQEARRHGVFAEDALNMFPPNQNLP